MDRHDLEAIALAVREQLRTGLSPLEPAPLTRLLQDTVIETRAGPLTVRVVSHGGLALDVWGVTTFNAEVDRAWIWLNEEAWPEVKKGVPRTRFTVAHELGHVVLHDDGVLDLDGRPEPDHQAQIEREANIFAAHLLIPDAALRRLEVTQATTPDALTRRFGVSSMMASKRLQEWLRRE